MLLNILEKSVLLSVLDEVHDRDSCLSANKAENPSEILSCQFVGLTTYFSFVELSQFTKF